jgi:hypothetical protein
VVTEETTEWTRRYHSNDPAEKAFGGSVSITLIDAARRSSTRSRWITPLGARPFAREHYIGKFPRARRPGILEVRGDRSLPLRSCDVPRMGGTGGPSPRSPVSFPPDRRDSSDVVLPSHPRREARNFRAAPVEQESQLVPGAFNPLSAKLIQDRVRRVYISRAVIAADLGFAGHRTHHPHRVANRAKQISHATDLPSSMRTGFGEPMNVARTVQGSRTRVWCLHIEDGSTEEVRPPRRKGCRRCGHRDKTHSRRSGCAPRPEPADHGANGHPRRRRLSMVIDRAKAGGCRGRRDLQAMRDC